MTTIYLAKFVSPMYPEDNQTFGAYFTEKEAEARCDEEHAYRLKCDPGFPEMYTKKRYCYEVDEIHLNGKSEGDVRYEKFRDWYLREGKRAEIDPVGHIRVTTKEIIDTYIDAMPEVKGEE